MPHTDQNLEKTMGDLFVDRILENEKILKPLTNEQVIMLALSELMMELTAGPDVPPGSKAKGISLASALSHRAGVKF